MVLDNPADIANSLGEKWSNNSTDFNFTKELRENMENAYNFCE